MNDFKKLVKKWLNDTGHDREWLGSVTRNPRTPDKSTPKRTIDRWLSPSSEPVPAWAELEIRKLMGNYCAESITNLEDLPQTEDLGKMFITLEPNVQDLVHQEAYRLGLTVTAYCSLAVEYAATNEEMRTEITSLHVSKKKSHSFNTDTTSPVVIGEGNAPSSNPLHQTTTTQGEDC